ncbi:MAG TPA: ATP-binding protein [Chryseobacterium sp.]|nr:ATP-binding protein [Chryseobacterium sp.]
MKKEKQKAVFSWSGGKDSALALHQIVQDDTFEVIALLTTLDADTETSSIHNIPLPLLEKQAASLGIPLYPLFLSKELLYDEAMRKAASHFKQDQATHFIFGDIFLEEVRQYRENLLAPLGLAVHAPLWGKTSAEVMEQFLQSGIRATLMVTQADRLGCDYIGRILDGELTADFPSDIDCCGENGEYHTFAFAGGPFRKEVPFQTEEVKLITHEFKLNTGETKKFEYWQAVLL